MQRKVLFSPGEYYHIYTRGVEKRKIFLNEKDHERFVALLYIMNQPSAFVFRDFLRTKKLADIFNESRELPIVSIVAYCLMPNHLHLILQEHEEGGISKFMSKILTSYSMYFNLKYKRSGSLFMHPFRSQHINNQSYYLYIHSYIHLNPISLIESGWKEVGIKNKKRVEKFLNGYLYSSYLDFQKGDRKELKILDLSKIPDYLRKKENLKDYIKYFNKTAKITKDYPL
ncbi:MAG: transposase [bacterium]|nr:transposase [bacterium]